LQLKDAGHGLMIAVRTSSMPLYEDELYQQRILDHYEAPFHRGQCPQLTHAHEDDNPLCGDRVRIELAIESDGTIRDAYFCGEGCCVSQAAASMLIERMQTRNVEDVKNFSGQDMLALFGAKLTPNRQKCCLLAWRTLQSALYSPLDAKRSGELGGANPSRQTPPLDDCQPTS
jgi:nitrogen fixation protein NifU and related proteins